MDYEKKYKEALERARVCHKDMSNLDGVVARLWQRIFLKKFSPNSKSVRTRG